MTLNIKKTTKSDIDRIMIILGEARKSMGKLGIDQWQYGYPTRDIVKEDVAVGMSYVVREEGDDEIYATFCIKEGGEPTYANIYEGVWMTKGDYVAIHRIAVCDAKRGTGMSDKILEFIIDECKKKGIYSIKVDTHRGNIPMLKFVERNGFVRCGIIYLADGEERIAFEKVIV